MAGMNRLKYFEKEFSIRRVALKVKKTIKGKILELRKGKEELLKREYENFQRYLHGDKTAPLYSATKQEAERFLKKIKWEN